MTEKYLQRFWVSWWSSYYANDGCIKPPFQIWINGSRNNRDKEELSIYAVLDLKNEAAIWQAVRYYFPDYEPRFCNPQSANLQPPADSFPDFRHQTSVDLCDD